MIQTFTRRMGTVLLALTAQLTFAQTTITQWNFNSVVPDASTATGTTQPSAGTGTLAVTGGLTASFASGTAGNGSSDPAPAADNSGYGLTGWPAQGTGNKTAGITFSASTSGYQNIQVSFDLRHSNTGPAHIQLQYCPDVTAGAPVWTDFNTAAATGGDTWFQRSFDLSSVTALNNNPHAGFRVVAAFAPATTAYAPANPASNYSTGGTWRFDMVTIKGSSMTPGDATPPVATTFKTTSGTTSFIRFNESLLASSASAPGNYTFNPPLAVSAATLNAGGDTIFLTHAPVTDGQPYTISVSGVQDLAGNTMSTASFNLLFNGGLPSLVITEIAHSPNTMEFIEVYNAGTTSVNLNGLKWTDGTTGDFPNVTLAPGSNILFSTNPASAAALMGGTYYTINNGLGASNDVLVIRNSLNQAIDSVDYYVGANNWPAGPSGVYGYSFELSNTLADNNLGTNWAVPANIISSGSGTIRATPGVYPALPPSPAPQVTSYRQVSATSSYVVFNQPVTAATATDVANYSFSPALTVNSAALSAGGDTVTLSHQALADGAPYTLNITGVANGSNVGNAPANLDLVWNQGIPSLVITEIMHSPNDIEMIEVYNAGATAINLGGLKWTDGTTGNFPMITLPADSAIVFATAPGTAAATFRLDTVYTINNGLGSSNDVLVIRNSLNQVIDSVDYYVGTNGWPAAPAGVYGYSFELNSAAADNSLGNNWAATTQSITPQPAQGIVRATPGVYPPPAPPAGSASLSFVGTRANIDETGVQVNIIANLSGGISPVTADLELIPMGTASQPGDFTLPATMQFSWPANTTNRNDTITITINNDALAENAEYFVLRMANAVNANLPAATNNNFTVFILDDDQQGPSASQNLTLHYLTSFGNGTPGVNSAEIVSYDAGSRRLFVANSIGARIDIVNFSNPAAPSLIASIPVTPYGNINSVAARNGLVAAAIENSVPELPGKVVFFDTNGVFISQVNVGAMPDMITFNHAGTKVLTANEGQPNTAYTIDPEGSVSIIDISGGAASVTQADVTTASFAGFNSQIAALKASGVRIFGPGATVAQDMEPEYITLSADDQYAWVTCQENNAIATLDMSTGTITQVAPLGTKDHMLNGNALDASDQGGVIQIANWPLKGLYMPDAVASFTTGGQTYLITANEGDAREYNGYEETGRLGDADYVLDPVAFPYGDILKANIGRINITTASGDTDGDGDFDEIHVYGGRSVSIWNAATGALVWDSGDDMELMIAKHPVFSAIFNASNANNTLKNRSDDKGPEPEGITVATINNRIYAFVALERMGGCMVYDVTDPAAPVWSDYANTRTIAAYGGDQGAEGIVFIPAAESPTGVPIVILANEVSSTLSIFQVQDNTPLNITLSAIDATNIDAQNRIDWTSATEAPGDRYELQRSRDGNSFTALAAIDAKGTPASYTHWDEQPLPGWNYYRLKTTGADGSLSYSKVVKAYRDAYNTVLVKAYPNPATDVLTVQATHFSGYAELQLQDLKGTVVRRKTMTARKEIIETDDIAPGIYLLKYTDKDHTETVKITKR